MKKNYLRPHTAVVKVAVQNLLAAISGTETESVTSNDPNNGNGGPSAETGGGNGGMGGAKGFDLWEDWE